MGDIITTFSKIGAHYLADEKRVNNKAYEYDTIKVYLFDIETKTIEPHLNIAKEDLIITRFGLSPRNGNLFPNLPFEPDDYEKFIRGIVRANKNFLSYFDEEEVKNNKLLKLLSVIDELFFTNFKENIQGLEKYKKAKGKREKFATYFSLSYQGQPISFYFKDVYNKHLNKSNKPNIYGYDIITNNKGVGGDANFAFCSVNELPKNLQGVKSRLLPLSYESAKKVKIGFDAVDKMLAHKFFGLIKIAIMPTVLSSDEVIYAEVLQILENVTKGNISEIEESEININEYLEEVVNSEKNLPVLNTILFYRRNKAAVDMLLQIDDILPSYISHISDRMGYHNIKAFKDKDRTDAENTIYMQNIYGDRLEIMNILLSSSKIGKDVLIHKFSQLIYWGNINKKYAYPLDWSKYFNGVYHNRSIEAIKRYLAFFKDTKKLKENFILQKEYSLEEINDKREKIIVLMENSEFLDNNEVLKTAYLLGMLSSALINWQYGINKSDSYAKWLNNSGVITKDTLERIWNKAELTSRMLNSTSGKGSTIVNNIKDLIVMSASIAFIDKDITKSAYVSLAFAMGGSDYTKHIKDKKKKEKK